MTPGTEPPPDWSRCVGVSMKWAPLAVRGKVRHGIGPEEAEALGCEPGFPEAVRYAVEVARAGHFLRYALWRTRWPTRVGRDISDQELYAWAWHTSGSWGRHWLEECAAGAGVRDAAGRLQQCVRDLHGGPREPVLAALARRSTAAMATDTDDLPRYFPGTASLNEALWLLAMRHAARLAPDADEPTRALAYATADFADNLAYLHHAPPLAAGVLVRWPMRYAWRVAGPDGRGWALAHAERLGRRGTLQRVILHWPVTADPVDGEPTEGTR
ncbi:hypothetical protein ACWERV_28220 [Streptomyces sp. NPDC004031]